MAGWLSKVGIVQAVPIFHAQPEAHSGRGWLQMAGGLFEMAATGLNNAGVANEWLRECRRKVAETVFR